jgi:2,3-bisphosphoglycerate-independent phosphoglycerate mutase
LKYLILLGDGMADWPLPDYDNRTPLEVANTPAMDALVSRGVLGRFSPIPEGMPPGSDIGNLSMFGYDPRQAFRGRAPMEAANQGITLAENEVAFRCNLVNIQDGLMRDFTAGHIETEEASQIIASLNEALADQFPAKFYPGVSYRHLCIASGETDEAVEEMVALACEPPHNITDKDVAPWLPHGPGNELTHKLMEAATAVLADHPVNKARIERGELPATHIWLWGQGKAPNVTPYKDKFGITGAVISAVDLVMGIGVCAGLDVIRVPGATGWIDTNYEGKSEAGLKALDDHDFVYIHLEAPDETAHQGRADLKIQAIEDYDAKIVAPALKYQETHPDVRILIAPDHFTTIETKTHAGGPVPFGICGPGITPNGHSAYSERAAGATDVLIEDGHTLVESMIRDAEMSFPNVAPA